MIIRQAKAADAAEIIAFWNPQIRETAITFNSIEKTAEDLAHDITGRLHAGLAYYVAELDGHVVGLATYAQFRAGAGYVHTMEHSIILAANARGRGIGRALMAKLETHARAAFVHSLIAVISAENEPALAFHSKAGFREVAMIPQSGRKFDRWMDLVILQKLIGNMT